MAMTTERFEVQREIEASPAEVFAVLSDPKGHVAIDSSGMLQSAEGEVVREVGDEFVVHMDREALNDYPMGKYDVTVIITDFQPDALIADVELPGMNGLDLLKQLGPELHDVPAIIITGRGSEERAVAAIEAGAFWYIEKPLKGPVRIPAAPRTPANPR